MNKLYTMNDYGKIYLDIESLMKDRGFTINSLSTEVGTNFDVIKRWTTGNIERLDTDVLARLCFVLDCEPGDILKRKK